MKNRNLGIKVINPTTSIAPRGYTILIRDCENYYDWRQLEASHGKRKRSWTTRVYFVRTLIEFEAPDAKLAGRPCRSVTVLLSSATETYFLFSFLSQTLDKSAKEMVPISRAKAGVS